jgi:hypothetical protein
MSEILLETLVDKVDGYQKQAREILEKIQALPDYSSTLAQVNQRIDSIEGEIKSIPERISIPEKDLLELQKELRSHWIQLQLPLKQEVRHHHHLSKPLIVCLALVGLVMTLIVLLNLAWDQSRQHQDADIKYRRMKLFDSPGIVRYLHYVDSLYLVDPDQMRKGVVQEEDRRQAELERLEKLQEKRGEVRELEKKVDQHPP